MGAVRNTALFARLWLGFATSKIRIASVARAMSVSVSARKRPFQPSPKLRGVFVGSGSDGMNEPWIAQAVLDMVDSKDGSSETRVVYIGTATYDMEGPRLRQTGQFVSKGCVVASLDVAMSPLTPQHESLLDTAEVIIVSGGNTLYAMDRWKLLGVDKKLRQAMERGAVLTGGSAGAICWFDGGHSDSADPDTMRQAMLARSVDGDESSGAPTSHVEAKSWEYIRVAGLGLLPGLVCPHYDKVQSNGVLRANDFDEMLLRHSNELGIGIDHWAALKVEGDTFSVISLPNREGSQLPDGNFSSERKGSPAIWLVRVKDGGVSRKVCSPSGKLCDLLFHPDEIVLDPREDVCRKQNPATH